MKTSRCRSHPDNQWDVCDTSNMSEKYVVATGRSFVAELEGTACGSASGRGLGEEPVRTVFSTQIPPSIALSILNMKRAQNLLHRLHQKICWAV